MRRRPDRCRSSTLSSELFTGPGRQSSIASAVINPHFEPVIPLPVEVPFVYDGPDGPQFTVALNHHADFTTTDGAVVWEADDRFQVFDGGANYREPTPLEAAHLEDFTGLLTLEADLFDYTVIPFGISGFQLPAVQMRGLPLVLAGTTVPLSRGLPCSDFATPCPLTDGELIAVDAGFREELTFTFARRRWRRTSSPERQSLRRASSRSPPDGARANLRVT